MNQDVTLVEAKDWLRARVEDGVECPCCTQFAKVYRRKIHTTMAADLITAYRVTGHHWFHLPTLLDGRHPGDFGKLAHWELVVEMPAVRADGSNRAGWWRVSDHGRRFVLGEIRVPKYAHLYDGRLLKLDRSEWVSIRDALGDRFNYDDLMNP